jgi:hypothetical protein
MAVGGSWSTHCTALPTRSICRRTSTRTSRHPLTTPRRRYARLGTNAIHLGTTDAEGVHQEGWKHTPGVNDDGPAGGPAGGRFDIGPEMLNPPRPTLWLGTYTAEITGPRSASLTSARCEATGAQLVRRFELAETGSRLLVTQVICNVSDSTKQYFHWSRSFAHGGGRVLIPLSESSRYPSKYIMYGGDGILTAPSDPNIQEREGFLEILGTPAAPYVDSPASSFPLTGISQSYQLPG